MVETFGNTKNIESHRSLVVKTFGKSENIIKLLILNIDDLASRFELVVEGGTLADLDKILFVKGLKRNDVAALVKKLEERS